MFGRVIGGAPVPADPCPGNRWLARHIRQVLAMQPPRDLETLARQQLVRRAFTPRVFGLERLAAKPCLFVGNHSLFALDALILTTVMLQEQGRFLRPLGERLLFRHPLAERILLSRGAAIGHPAVCAALMEAGQDILLFPGGTREGVKPVSQRYRLQWGHRFGFLRLAARHGYTVQPVGIVGPDEFYDQLISGAQMADSPPGRLLQRLGIITPGTRRDLIPPLPLGALGSLLPKPRRCYIGFAEPLDLSRWTGQIPTQSQLRGWRDETAGRIDSELRELLLYREQRRGEDGLLRRILTL